MLMPILRDMAHAVRILITNALLCDIFAIHDDLCAGFTLFKSGQSRDKFTLSVPVNARNTNDLPRMDLQRNVIHRVFLVQTALHRHMLDLKHCPSGLRIFFIHGEFDVSANHHA